MDFQEHSNIVNVSTLMKEVLKDYPGETEVAIDGQDPAAIFFTSGTTGAPKAIVSTHFTARNWLGNGVRWLSSSTDNYVMLCGTRTIAMVMVIYYQFIKAMY